MQKMLLWKNNFIWPIDSTSEVKHSLFIYYLCVKSFLLFFFRFLQFPLYFLIFFFTSIDLNWIFFLHLAMGSAEKRAFKFSAVLQLFFLSSFAISIVMNGARSEKCEHECNLIFAIRLECGEIFIWSFDI